MDPVDQLPFMIGLAALHVVAEPGTGLATEALDVGQRLVAVHGGLARAEQVQVGAVEYKDGWHCGLLSGR